MINKGGRLREGVEVRQRKRGEREKDKKTKKKNRTRRGIKECKGRDLRNRTFGDCG